MKKTSWNAWDEPSRTPDALARVDLLSGDPALDRRLAVLADADPLGLLVPRRACAADELAALRDHASPQHHAYRLPKPVYRPAARTGDSDG